MTRRKNTTSFQDGFTLIEIIVTIIIASILGAFMVEFVGTAVQLSGDPVLIVQDDAYSEGLLEKIISDYVKEINTASDLNEALNTIKGTSYGSTVSFEYIEFDAGGAEISSVSSNILKATIQGKGYSLTTLLTKSRNQSDDPATKY